MGRFPQSHPSFFKVMIGDFTIKLKIPPLFVKNYEGMISNKCILKTDEKSWRVNTEQDQNNYFCKDGWRKFVTDNNVEMGDFLLFFLVDVSTFHVMIYGRTCCPKTFSSAHFENVQPTLVEIEETESAEEEEEEDDDDVREEVVDLTEAEHPHCEILFKKYFRYFMDIPTKFARETGILRKGKTMFKDPEGQTWPVGVHSSSNGRGAQIGSGWSAFRKANKLVVGDKCLFQFIGGLIQVHFLRKERQCDEKWRH